MVSRDPFDDLELYDYLLQTITDHKSKLLSFEFSKITCRPTFSVDFLTEFWFALVKKANISIPPKEIGHDFDMLLRSVYQTCESLLDIRLTCSRILYITGKDLDSNSDIASKVKFMIILIYASQWAAKLKNCPSLILKEDIFGLHLKVKQSILLLLEPIYENSSKISLEVICGLMEDEEQKENFDRPDRIRYDWVHQLIISSINSEKDKEKILELEEAVNLLKENEAKQKEYLEKLQKDLDDKDNQLSEVVAIQNSNEKNHIYSFIEEKEAAEAQLQGLKIQLENVSEDGGSKETTKMLSPMKNEKLEKLEKNIADLQESKRRLEENERKQNKCLEQFRLELSNKEKQLHEALTSVTETQTCIQALSEENQSFKDQLEKASLSEETTYETILKLEATKVELENEAPDFKKYINELEKNEERLNETLKNLEMEVADKNKNADHQIQNLYEEKQSLEERFQKALNDKDAALEKVSFLEMENGALANQFDNISLEAINANKIISSIKTEKSELEEKLFEMQQSVNLFEQNEKNLNETLKKLQIENADKDKQFQEAGMIAQNRIQTLSEEKSELASQLEKASLDFTNANKIILSLKTEKAELEDKILELQESVEGIRQDEKKLDKTLEKLHEDFHGKNDQLAEALANLSEAQNSNHTLLEERQSLENQLEKAMVENETCNQIILKLEATNVELEDEASELQKHINRFERNEEKLNETLKALEMELENKNEEICASNDLVNSNSNKMAAILEELKIVNETKTELENEFFEVKNLFADFFNDLSEKWEKFKLISLDELMNEKDRCQSLLETIDTLQMELRERSRTPSLHEEGIHSHDSRQGIHLPLVSLDDEKDLIKSSEVFENENDSGLGSHEQTPENTPRENAPSVVLPLQNRTNFNICETIQTIFSLVGFLMFCFSIYIYFHAIYIPSSFYIKVRYDSPPPT